MISAFQGDVYNLIHKISSRIDSISREIAARYGLTNSQAYLLLQAAHSGEHTVGALGRVIGLNTANASAACKKLEKMGLLRRVRSRKDERFVRVALTEQGTQVACCLSDELNRRYASFVGVVCEESVARLAADVAFISTSSLYETTLYHQDQEQLTIKRAMLAASARRVLLVDHSKIGQRALYRLCDLAEFTHVVVDSGTSEESLRMLAEHGAELIVAETS